MGFLGAPVCLLFPERKAFLKQSIKDWQMVKMNYPIRVPAHLGLDMPPLFNHFHKLLTASSVSLQGSGSQARADLGTVPGEMKLQIRAAWALVASELLLCLKRGLAQTIWLIISIKREIKRRRQAALCREAYGHHALAHTEDQRLSLPGKSSGC